MKKLLCLLAAAAFGISLLSGAVCSRAVASVAFQAEPGRVTLPADAQVDGILAGWSATVGDEKIFLAPGAEYTAQQRVEFTPVSVRMSMTGAFIRTQSPAGLRFTTRVMAQDYQSLKASAAAFHFGTLIAPTDSIGSSFTAEALAQAGEAHLQAKTTVWQTIRAAERTYTAVLADLKESNYNRYFSAVPYIEITYTDGHTQTLYGSYDPQVQSAAAYPLAADALGQMQGYTEAERSVFQLYYDRVGVDLLLPPAAAGEAPQAALYRTPGARYGVWTDWVCQFVEPMHEIFQNDFGYQATITVTPAAGASFSENTKLYLNGEPLTQGYSFDEKGRLIIIKRYALGNYTWAY